MKRSRGGGPNLASCAVAVIFLVLVIFALLVVFFTLFRPQNPSMGVHGVQIPSFSLRNDSLSLTLSIFAWIRNPNRASSFDHYDSTAKLLYAGNQAGSMFIPAGTIEARRTQLMTITFSVRGFPLTAAASPANFRPYATSSITIEVEARMRMTGRVKVLHFFTHHAESTVDCTVTIDERDGNLPVQSKRGGVGRRGVNGGSLNRSAKGVWGSSLSRPGGLWWPHPGVGRWRRELQLGRALYSHV